eukprot:9485971-Pyramimonas_sp.AAC.1
MSGKSGRPRGGDDQEGVDVMAEAMMSPHIPWRPLLAVDTHAKKHPACLQDALGLLGFYVFWQWKG